MIDSQHKPAWLPLVLISGALGFALLVLLIAVSVFFQYRTSDGTEQWQTRHVRLETPLYPDLEARHYSFLSYQLDEPLPGAGMVLYWRNRQSGRRLFNADVPQTGPQSGRLRLDGLPNWKDTIIELALVAETEDKTGNRYADLTVSPFAMTEMFRTIFAEWSSSFHRSQTTINYLPGAPRNSFIFPLAAVTAWLSISLVFLIIFGRRRGKNIWRPALPALIIAAWLVLDLRWLNNLYAEVANSYNQYSGKTIREKYLAGRDADLYRFIEKAKNSWLPDQPNRIFIIPERPRKGHDYQRLKAQYFLLPHNVFNFKSWPPENLVKEGDYVLYLGKLPNKNTVYANNQLTNAKGKTLIVDRLGKSRDFSFFKILAR